ncbi:MAG: 4'-phosphopantetheinyl transferase superfamily protein, partial [Desulfovibrio sp.]|nr:4'-phosphopantetheinyl transferase superfamily protein [Desulfovibrio sp.]
VVRILVTDIRPLIRPQAFAAALQRVGPARRREALRYARAEDRCLSLGAALLLAHCLSRDGHDLTTVRVLPEHGPGKPYCPGIPGFHYNLSHAGRFAACVTAAVPVGIDVEPFGLEDDYPLERALTPHETAWLEAEGRGERPERFARLWTRKEAYLKAIGTGLAVSPAGVDVTPGKDPLFHGGALWRLREYPLAGHALSVCAAGEEPFAEAQSISVADLFS